MKKSRDLEITGRADWNDVSATLMGAVLKALMAYLRTYPHTIVAPLMLEHRPADGGPARRLGADDLSAMDDGSLLGLVQQLLRPGSINLQRYTAGEGVTPTGIASSIRAMRTRKRCTAPCCGRSISMIRSRRARPSSSTSVARWCRRPGAC